MSDWVPETTGRRKMDFKKTGRRKKIKGKKKKEKNWNASNPGQSPASTTRVFAEKPIQSRFSSVVSVPTLGADVPAARSSSRNAAAAPGLSLFQPVTDDECQSVSLPAGASSSYL